MTVKRGCKEKKKNKSKFSQARNGLKVGDVTFCPPLCIIPPPIKGMGAMEPVGGIAAATGLPHTPTG